MKGLLCPAFCFAVTVAAGQPGTITYGPAPASPVKPQVLVFVHGWSAGAETWTVGNDMPTRASRSGYRTAFVDLYSDRNMWDNGTLLASEINQILGHFGTTHVTLVAHSKGAQVLGYALQTLRASNLVAIGPRRPFRHAGSPVNHKIAVALHDQAVASIGGG